MHLGGFKRKKVLQEENLKFIGVWFGPYAQRNFFFMVKKIPSLGLGLEKIQSQKISSYLRMLNSPGQAWSEA